MWNRSGKNGNSSLIYYLKEKLLESTNSVKLQYVKCESHSVMSHSLQPYKLQPAWLLCAWNSPGQNTGVGSHSLLQGIFPTQWLSPGLLHCRLILYQLSQRGSPKILEWVAYSFSSRSSQPRNRTRVPCIAGGFFTNCAIREAPGLSEYRKFWHNEGFILNAWVW